MTPDAARTVNWRRKVERKRLAELWKTTIWLGESGFRECEVRSLPAARGLSPRWLAVPGIESDEHRRASVRSRHCRRNPEGGGRQVAAELDVVWVEAKSTPRLTAGYRAGKRPGSPDSGIPGRMRWGRMAVSSTVTLS